MRLVMMGTGPFAVPTLLRLFDSRHEVVALVTRPAREVHGKADADVNPMRTLAAARGLPVFTPESINAAEAQDTLAGYGADLFVVCDYGQILAPSTLALPRLGGINLHASLLPKYRGAAPINWAIYHGELTTGVTVIHMTPRLDAGPAIAQAETPIGADETAAQLEPRLAQLGAPLVLAAIDDLAAGTAQPLLQDSTQATQAPRLKKSDGQIDWSRPATALRAQVRAFDPWPKTYTFRRREVSEPLRLILAQVAVVPMQPAVVAVEPGTVLEASGQRLLVAGGQDALEIQKIQPAGKRVLTAGEFLRGYPLRPGERLG